MPLASIVSKTAFVAISLFMIGLVQFVGGGLLSGYNPGAFFEISVDEGKTIIAKIINMASSRAEKPTVEARFAAAALIFPRVEAALFFGMGMGAVVSLAFLKKGTKEVAIAHLMHAVWGYSVCCCHAQNAGFLPIPSEIDPSVQPMLAPFVVMTFTLGSLSAAAAYLSFTAKPKKA